MKHTIHGKGDPQIPNSYDALAEFETFGSEVILTTYGPRGGVRGYICLDKNELKMLLGDLTDCQIVAGRLSKTRYIIGGEGE